MAVVYGINFEIVYFCSGYLLLSNHHPKINGLKQFVIHYFIMIFYDSVH